MPDSNTHIVKSAQRVLEVIEFFNEDRPSASVTDVSRALSYPQSSTSVLLRCLRQLGFLYYDRFTRTYRLTTRAALLGCSAEAGNFRGGRTIDLLDAISARTDETVVLSVANVDYALHHLHVLKGTSDGAVGVEPGSIETILHNVQGELQLATYPDKHIKLALHRLNAEEFDPDKRVNVSEKLAEMQVMRDVGWAIGPIVATPGVSAVAINVPRHKGGDRVIVSVVAKDGVISRDGEELLAMMLEERDRIFAEDDEGDHAIASRQACEIGRPGGDILAMQSATGSI